MLVRLLSIGNLKQIGFVKFLTSTSPNSPFSETWLILNVITLLNNIVLLVFFLFFEISFLIVVFFVVLLIELLFV